MFYTALATDYDGTIAHHGGVHESTVAALRKVKESGRKLILVTGRELPDLREAFPKIDLFDRVVAENGALLYTPASEEEKPIAPPPSPEFVAELERRGVSPLSVGRSIVATWEPHQDKVLEVIRQLGLELDIVFNKGAVMILSGGINKASGLTAALADLGLSAHNTVGVGDAENDHAFLRLCGCSAAVANALAAVKDTADIVLAGARGAGVEELVERLVQDGELGFTRQHDVAIGRLGEETQTIAPSDTLLIAGSSGIGKSTLATALTEGFVEKGFQFFVFDPEGDYDGLENSVMVGDGKTAPACAQAMALLEKPDSNVVVSTLALDVADRPDFFAEIMPEVGRMRARTGRPHWLVIDEAHHLLPKERDDTPLVLSMKMPGSVLITVHPDAVAKEALRHVPAVAALGPKANEVIASFCAAAGIQAPATVPAPDKEHVLFWRPGSGEPPRAIRPVMPKQSRKRHSRKYAEGHLDEAGSFYFRGPDDTMKLRAQNLMIFVQIAEGIDDDTWEHHLRAGDYSDWFRRQIRDDKLADEAAAVEQDADADPQESRDKILGAVRKRYTAPATAP